MANLNETTEQRIERAKSELTAVVETAVSEMAEQAAAFKFMSTDPGLLLAGAEVALIKDIEVRGKQQGGVALGDVQIRLGWDTFSLHNDCNRTISGGKYRAILFLLPNTKGNK